jgi:hypothetical protein
MAKTQNPKFPMPIKSGTATVTIYRGSIKRQGAPDRTIYQVRWPGCGKEGFSKSDLDEAILEATLKASQLADGLASAKHISVAETLEFHHCDRIAKELGIENVSIAMAQWADAFRKTEGKVNQAADYFVEFHPKAERIMLSALIELFIDAKEELGEGERTYRSKLKSILAGLGDRYIDAFKKKDYANFLKSIPDKGNRKDARKRLVTLCRWARKEGYLPDNAVLEVERTDGVNAPKKKVEIIQPPSFEKSLNWVRANDPANLAALVLHGFGGIRADEVHGKRAKSGLKARPASPGVPARAARPHVPRSAMPRQKWGDIHLDGDNPRIVVTVAKNNTAQMRVVPLCPAAIAWLKLCFVDGKKPEGYVCDAGALEQVRKKLIAANLCYLPENCFRHSFCSYRWMVLDLKTDIACDEAGHSKEVFMDFYKAADLDKKVSHAWFEIMPPN